MTKPKQPHPTDVYVGERVKLRRKMMEVSQEKLAEALGVTFQQVQKYEKGTNRISAGRLHDISKFLKVPITFFFEHIQDNGDIGTAERALLDATHIPGSIQLLQSYGKLPDTGRKALLLTATTMLDPSSAAA